MQTSTKEFYESLYSTTWRPETLYDNRFVNTWYKAFIQHLLPSLHGGDALEVGCGYGYIAPLLADHGFTFTGTDIAKNAVDQIKSFPASVSSAENLPFKDNCFDLTLCMEVLEHVFSPESAIAELFRVCRDTVVISIPSYFNFYLPIKLAADLGCRTCREYMVWQIVDRNFMPWSLDKFISKHGNIVSRRSIRIAPPFFEKTERHIPILNDLIFLIEGRLGSRWPARLFGLHTLIVAKKVS